MNRELLQPVCRYISDVLESGTSNEKIVARTIMHLLPLDAVVAAPMAPAEPADTTIDIDKEAVADVIAEGLRGAYHCTRVWSAWGVGTMTEDDFAPVDESDTPAELADAVLALFAAPVAPAEPAEGWVLVPKRMTQEMRDVTDSEGWTWEDLLAEAGSISQEEYAAIAAAPVAPAEQSHAVSYMEGISDGRAEVKPALEPADVVEWAAQKWRDEVANRPLVNVHRRSLDDTWRQVMRHFGGDPDELVGPSHDARLAANGIKP